MSFGTGSLPCWQWFCKMCWQRFLHVWHRLFYCADMGSVNVLTGSLHVWLGFFTVLHGFFNRTTVFTVLTFFLFFKVGNRLFTLLTCVLCVTSFFFLYPANMDSLNISHSVFLPCWPGLFTCQTNAHSYAEMGSDRFSDFFIFIFCLLTQVLTASMICWHVLFVF